MNEGTWKLMMSRYTGNITEENVELIKEELKSSIVFNKERHDKVGNMTPPEIDLWHYTDKYNHIRIKRDNGLLLDESRYGINCMISDLHNVENKNNLSLTEIIPSIFLDELVIKSVSREKVRDNTLPTIYFYHLKHDRETGMLFYTCYEEHRNDKIKNAGDGSPVIEMIVSMAMPIEMAYPVLLYGMKSNWEDVKFKDYPVMIAWNPGEPYKLIRESSRHNDFDTGLIQEYMERAFGLNRYFIKLSEDRNTVRVEPDKERNKLLPAPTTEEEKKEYRRNKKSIITLNDDIKIYAMDAATVRRVRSPRPCEYRYSVRGHYRQYKNGKRIFIESYEKNKNKPFRAHAYA